MKHFCRAPLTLLLIFALMPVTLVPAFAVRDKETGTEIDYHRSSPLLTEVYGERCIQQAGQVIDAFFAGEDSVILDDYQTGDLAKVQYLLAVMCPVFTGTTFAGWDCFNDDTHEFCWKNLYTPDEAAELARTFEDICLTYLDKLQVGDSDLVKYLSLYYDFTSEREYNDTLQDELNAATSEEQSYLNSGLRCMIEYTGQCAVLSQCYAFLCIQAGLDAATVCSSEPIGHQWDIICLDGRYYYCDPTWDLPEDGQAKLSDFGMTAEYRELESGFAPENTEFPSCGNSAAPASFGLDDDRFANMHGFSFERIISFTIDHQANTVTVENADGCMNVLR